MFTQSKSFDTEYLIKQKSELNQFIRFAIYTFRVYLKLYKLSRINFEISFEYAAVDLTGNLRNRKQAGTSSGSLYHYL